MNLQRQWDTPRKVKLGIEDFLRLNDAGAFDGYCKTELIDGEIVAVNAQWVRHSRFQSGFFRRLADAVDRALPGYETLVEVSVALPPRSLLQPDITVTNFAASGREAVPIGTVPLLVEVADTTQGYDLGKKLRAYAKAGLPEYWVADLEARKILQFWSPGAKGFGQDCEVVIGERIEAATIAGLGVETAGLGRGH